MHIYIYEKYFECFLNALVILYTVHCKPNGSFGTWKKDIQYPQPFYKACQAKRDMPFVKGTSFSQIQKHELIHSSYATIESEGSSIMGVVPLSLCSALKLNILRPIKLMKPKKKKPISPTIPRPNLSVLYQSGLISILWDKLRKPI